MQITTLLLENVNLKWDGRSIWDGSIIIKLFRLVKEEYLEAKENPNTLLTVVLQFQFKPLDSMKTSIMQLDIETGGLLITKGFVW